MPAEVLKTLFERYAGCPAAEIMEFPSSGSNRPNKVFLTVLLESSGHGRGTKYHICREKVALPEEKVALRKRYRFEELRERILSFCSEWRTVEEIASEFGKQPQYVKNKVLPRLTDVLEKMYDIPHHPRQKYRANPSND